MRLKLTALGSTLLQLSRQVQPVGSLPPTPSEGGGVAVLLLITIAKLRKCHSPSFGGLRGGSINVLPDTPPPVAHRNDRVIKRTGSLHGTASEICYLICKFAADIVKRYC